MKNLARLLCIVITLSFTCIPVRAADEKTVIEIHNTDMSESGVYTDKNAPEFYLQINNIRQNKDTVSLAYTVENLIDTGAPVWSSGTEVFSLDANSTVIKGIKPEMQGKFGKFSITAKLTGSFGTTEHSVNFSVSHNNEKTADDVGFSCHFCTLDEDYINGNKMLRQSGSGYVRDEVRWHYVEKEKGVYNVDEYYENRVNEVVKNGNKSLLILCFGNKLYEKNEGEADIVIPPMPVTKEGIAAYARYCGFVAEHFKGRVDAFEIWNEPETPLFGGGIEKTGTQYAEIVKAAYTAIKNANPNALVVAGATSTLAGTGTVRFMKEFLSVENIGNYFDVLSFHPYVSFLDGKYYSDEAPNIYYNYNYNYDFKTQLSMAEGYLKDNNMDKPIWLTEFGTSTYESEKGYTERQQAINLARTAVMAKSRNSVEKIFFYNFIEKGSDKTDKESMFGVVTQNMNPKPAYIAISNLNYQLNGADFVKADAKEDNTERKYSYYQFRNEDENKDVFVFWTNKNKNSSARLNIEKKSGKTSLTASSDAIPKLTINLDSDSYAEFYDIYGNKLTNWDYGKDYYLSESLLYVVCKKTEREPIVNISYEKNGISVIGENIKPGELVTVTAKNEIKPDKPLCYIDQTTADENGKFEFKFRVENDEFYSVYVYNGADMKNLYNPNAEYEMEISYLINNVPCIDLSELKNGDKVRAVLNIRKKNADNDLTFYAVMRTENSAVIAINMADVIWDDENKSKVSIDFAVENGSLITSADYYLWDNSQRAVIPNTKIAK